MLFQPGIHDQSRKNEEFRIILYYQVIDDCAKYIKTAMLAYPSIFEGQTGLNKCKVWNRKGGYKNNFVHFSK